MKILIGCPTYERYDYVVDLWLKAVKKIIEFSKQAGHEVDYLLVDNSKTQDFYLRLQLGGANIVKSPYVENVRQRIVESRNVLREKTLKEKYDYFFSLEQDIIPEEDILVGLLKQNKKIISAYYSKNMGMKVQDKETLEIKDITLELPIVYLQQEGGVKRANPKEVLNKGTISVGAFGVGCLLIHRDVLEKIKFRFERGKIAFDDLLFCLDAKNLGYQLFLDSNIKVIHLHKPWDEIKQI